MFRVLRVLRVFCVVWVRRVQGFKVLGLRAWGVVGSGGFGGWFRIQGAWALGCLGSKIFGEFSFWDMRLALDPKP